MKLFFKKYAKVLYLIPIIIFSIGVYFISPASIVNHIGVENSYLFMFCIALIGGISLFSGVPYPMILVTLALGGANPYILGVSAAVGVMLGDSTSYLVGKKGSEIIIPSRLKLVLEKLLIVYDKYPKYLPTLFFVYGVVSPFPNDVITLSAGIKKYSYWYTILPLAMGNIIFCIMLARFSSYFSNYL